MNNNYENLPAVLNANQLATLLIMADSTKKIVDTAKDYKKPSADQLKLGIIVTYEQDTLSIAKIVKNLCHIKKNRKRRND